MLAWILSLFRIQKKLPDIAAVADLSPTAKARALDLEERIPELGQEAEAYARALSRLYRELTLARYAAALEEIVERINVELIAEKRENKRINEEYEAEIDKLSELKNELVRTQINESARAGRAEGALAEAQRKIQDLEREAKYR